MLTSQTLEKFAKDHTAPKPGRAYRDNDDVKKLFRRARLLQTREAVEGCALWAATAS